ncbi:MAG: hypothetical protein J7521_16170 [Caulobacter sp.]|nr:hypothetical protein [Caulobacter sp.]
MSVQVLESVLADAATPQKVVLVVLMLAVLAGPVLAALARVRSGPWRSLISGLAVAGPALGLLVGALNSFHMARTVQKLPYDVTVRQLAPGVLEVAVFVALGAVVGLAAVASLAAAGARRNLHADG